MGLRLLLVAAAAQAISGQRDLGDRRELGWYPDRICSWGGYTRPCKRMKEIGWNCANLARISCSACCEGSPPPPPPPSPPSPPPKQQSAYERLKAAVMKFIHDNVLYFIPNGQIPWLFELVGMVVLVCVCVPFLICCHFLYVRCNTTIHHRRRSERVRGWVGPCRNSQLVSRGRWVAPTTRINARRRGSDSDSDGSVELSSVVENAPLVRNKPFDANEYELRDNHSSNVDGCGLM